MITERSVVIGSLRSSRTSRHFEPKALSGRTASQTFPRFALPNRGPDLLLRVRVLTRGRGSGPSGPRPEPPPAGDEHHGDGANRPPDVSAGRGFKAQLDAGGPRGDLDSKAPPLIVRPA